VILTEALGPTDATFLSEVKQLNGGKMIPVIGTSADISPDWYKSVAAAIGASTVASSFHADNLVTETSGPSYTPFYSAIMSEKGKVGSTGNFATYLTAPGAVHLYDGINLAALAMIEAKSTTPSVYAPYIIKIGDGTAGAVVVHSFAEGVTALKAGKAIRYEGPGGPTSFDSYHDSPGIFQIDTYSSSGAVQVAGNITAAQLRDAERLRGALPGARAAAGRVQPAVPGLPVGLRGHHARPGGRGLLAGAAGDRIALRAVAAGDARQRRRGRLAGQEPGLAAGRDARAGRLAGRAERRAP